jgi:DNA-binding NtrC family response regulator
MKNTWCVLIVEDDYILGPRTFDTLHIFGHTATLASSVYEAYGHLSTEHTFEVMLLDLQLGSERGEELIDRLNREGRLVPRIVIFSAQPIFEIERSVRAVAAHGYVQKPAMPRDSRRPRPWHSARL